MKVHLRAQLADSSIPTGALLALLLRFDRCCGIWSARVSTVASLSPTGGLHEGLRFGCIGFIRSLTLTLTLSLSVDSNPGGC